MAIHPIPFLNWEGVGAALTPLKPSNGGMVAVHRLSIDWGRSNLLEQPEPGSAVVSLLVRSAHRRELTAAVGTTIYLGYITPSTVPTQVNHRGRITAADIDYLDRNTPDGSPRYIVTLYISSVMSEMKQATGPDLFYGVKDPLYNGYSVSVNAATVAAALQAKLPPVMTRIETPSFQWQLVRSDMSESDLLEATQRFYSTTGHTVSYLPHASEIKAVGAQQAANHMGARLALFRPPAGPVRITPRTFAGQVGAGYIDAETCELAPARQDSSTGQRYLDHTYYVAAHNQHVGNNMPLPFERTRRISTGHPGRAETVFSIDTIGYDNAVPGWGWENQGAYWTEERLKDKLQDAGRFTHPPLRMDHRAGFETEADVFDALSGVEQIQPLYISGSVFNPLAEYPVFRTIGGTIEYSDGRWTTMRIIAPVKGPAVRNTVPLESLDPAAAITWEDFAPGITLDDLDNLEAGL